MKNKNKFLLLSICGLLLTSCTKAGTKDNNSNNNNNNNQTHIHTFESLWSSDSGFHWHAATCEHSSFVEGMGKHEFGDWAVEKDSTIVEEGLRTKTCTVCNYKLEEIIAKKHAHTFESSWSFDENNHWHAATCEHVDEINMYGQHTFGDWVIQKDSTISEFGNKTKTCSECGYVLNERIDKKPNKGLALENPYTIDEAIAIMSDYSSNQVSDNEFYIKGVVAEATYNESYDSYTIYFEGHEKNSAQPFQLYSAKISSAYVNGDYEASDLVGKYIKAFGYFKLYLNTTSNKKIYEMPYLKSSESPTGYSYSPSIRYIGDSIEDEHVHTYETTYTYDENAHWYKANCEHTDLVDGYEEHSFGDWIIDSSATSTSKGNKHRVCGSCGYRENEDIEYENNGEGSFTVYSFNDFHGAVKEYSSSSHAGLARFGTYLKNVSKESNTIIIDSGDTFQGSIESNYNRGQLITDVFNSAHVDVHTLGNHDFDWGEDVIEANKARDDSTDGWRMTNLGANIYDYTFTTKTQGTSQQSRLGEKYYIKTLENGFKVGIIGTIGSDQITSICSPLVEDICFKNHISYIKDLSDELRNEKGCDFVIASVHNSCEGLLNNGLTDVSPVSGKKYVDYVVGGHSHANEKLSENDVYFTQASSYGQMMYKATFNISSNEVASCDVSEISYSTIKSATSKIDSKIQAFIDHYGAESSEAGNEVITSASGSFSQTGELPNLLCKAIYTTARNQGYNVVLANVNKARYSVYSSSWTYSTIYEAFPFDNVVYIVKVKGSKNIQQLCNSYNYVYHDSSFTSMNSSSEYLVAVIDYLLWHTDAERNYDYFNHNSGYMEIVDTIKNSNGENFLYRDILANYLHNQNTTIVSSDYSSSNSEYTKPTY